MSKSGQSKLTKRGMSCVRMSPLEYRRIKEDSEKLGKSIPELFRESYFSQLPKRVLMRKDDVTLLRKDLNRIGNNLNQIAKKLNAGLIHGWSNKLDLVLEQFEILTSQIYYGYGVHKS